jgi:hypothetical protein
VADLLNLRPAFRPWAELLITVARERLSPNFVITSAYRSRFEQADLYSRWLRGEQGIYTPAKPGTSPHEHGIAVDIARKGVNPKSDPLLAALGEAWRAAGGLWPGPQDPVHFQWPFK